ncbi:MAG: hypothetical protein Rubg2KO_08980 [Rubricoccaceae bacterium]
MPLRIRAILSSGPKGTYVELHTDLRDTAFPIEVREEEKRLTEPDGVSDRWHPSGGAQVSFDFCNQTDLRGYRLAPVQTMSAKARHIHHIGP